MKSVSLHYDNIKVSLNSIRANLLRSVLTMLIIAIGIMALVGILTAIDSIKNSLNKQFATMGANTFTIESRGMNIQLGNQHYRKKNYSYISFRQAAEFKYRFTFPATTSLSTYATSIATVKYKSTKTNPNIVIIGTDENYALTAGYEVEKGRNYSAHEIEMNRTFAVIGADLANKLFDKNEDPLGKVITIGGGKFKIVGVLKKKGSSLHGSDNLCLLPYTVVRQYFSRPRRNYSISITPNKNIQYDLAVGQAESLFRIVRGLRATDESDFNITKSDVLSKILLENTKKITIAATIIAIITLFGAAIGLLNIMLVAVADRTREIGIRKAIGARNQTIRQQFLYEAVIICQYGGVIGIILGILIGIIVSFLMKIPFTLPWKWMIVGLALCSAVGLFAGLYPAVKASKLDPIAALRYE